jgi:hypothetical protein
MRRKPHNILLRGNIYDFRFEQKVIAVIHRVPEVKRNRFLELLEKVDRCLATYDDLKEIYSIVVNDIPELKDEFEMFLMEKGHPVPKPLPKKPDNYKNGMLLLALLIFSLLLIKALNSEK